MITGMVGCGNSVGATVGPVAGGVIIDMLGFPWMSTMMAGLAFVMVSLKFLFFCLIVL